MAWKEIRGHDERVNFVMEVETGEESVAAICRAYGISRKSGYQWLLRYQSEGVAGLADRSRAPRGRRSRHPRVAGATANLGRTQAACVSPTPTP